MIEWQRDIPSWPGEGFVPQLNEALRQTDRRHRLPNLGGSLVAWQLNRLGEQPRRPVGEVLRGIGAAVVDGLAHSGFMPAMPQPAEVLGVEASPMAITEVTGRPTDSPEQ